MMDGGASSMGPIMSSSASAQPGWGTGTLLDGKGLDGLMAMGKGGGMGNMLGGAGGQQGQQQQPQMPPPPGAAAGNLGGKQSADSSFPWLAMAPVIRGLAQRSLHT